ncbi:hypothetical protein M427DRAFT_391735 [Gonapodya prolifera JEL478]|uniref:Uncharacterized protein n=1 Tax=Gonapodya prolifera (strain JEL478) TaxID=1344416 RepID=A0A139A7T2_GONPJ|nr:hypothetical protein M427DRAFT_391735 [Gonapodya prolifera JEL478]|eukprot:KXS12764.1 hypothetical protein M427DRAFT_391735 [Gonapodya prolifera JEL478]
MMTTIRTASGDSSVRMAHSLPTELQQMFYNRQGGGSVAGYYLGPDAQQLYANYSVPSWYQPTAGVYTSYGYLQPAVAASSYEQYSNSQTPYAVGTALAFQYGYPTYNQMPGAGIKDSSSPQNSLKAEAQEFPPLGMAGSGIWRGPAAVNGGARGTNHMPHRGASQPRGGRGRGSWQTWHPNGEATGQSQSVDQKSPGSFQAPPGLGRGTTSSRGVSTDSFPALTRPNLPPTSSRGAPTDPFPALTRPNLLPPLREAPLLIHFQL